MGVCAVVLLLIGVGGSIYLSGLEEGYPKKSPFAAVRWQENKPEVEVGDEWFRLVSVDDVSVVQIVSFSEFVYRDNWRKGFEEELVDLLTRTGHPPGETVTLVVQSLTSGETRILNDVPMTKENLSAIRDATQGRERSAPQQGNSEAAPVQKESLDSNLLAA